MFFEELHVFEEKINILEDSYRKMRSSCMKIISDFEIQEQKNIYEMLEKAINLNDMLEELEREMAIYIECNMPLVGPVPPSKME